MELGFGFGLGFGLGLGLVGGEVVVRRSRQPTFLRDSGILELAAKSGSGLGFRVRQGSFMTRA